jgi:hypothetical protein
MLDYIQFWKIAATAVAETTATMSSVRTKLFEATVLQVMQSEVQIHHILPHNFGHL